MSGGSILGGVYSGSLLKPLVQLLSVWQDLIVLRGSQVPVREFWKPWNDLASVALPSLSFTNAPLSSSNPCAIKLTSKTCTSQ